MQNIIRKSVLPIETEAYEILRAIQAYEYSVSKPVFFFALGVSKLKFILCEISDQKEGSMFVLPCRDPTHKPSGWAFC
jgi:hypothetical protein